MHVGQASLHGLAPMRLDSHKRVTLNGACHVLRQAKSSFSNPLGYFEPVVCMGFWLAKYSTILDLHQEGACFPENSGGLFAYGRMA